MRTYSDRLAEGYAMLENDESVSETETVLMGVHREISVARDGQFVSAGAGSVVEIPEGSYEMDFAHIDAAIDAEFQRLPNNIIRQTAAEHQGIGELVYHQVPDRHWRPGRPVMRTVGEPTMVHQSKTCDGPPAPLPAEPRSWRGKRIIEENAIVARRMARDAKKAPRKPKTVTENIVSEASGRQSRLHRY